MDDLQVSVRVSVDELINVVSQHIGKEWKSLARAMSFTKTDIDSIEYDNTSNLKEQICQLFHQWKLRMSVKATPKLLLDVIKKAELHDVIKVLLDNQYITRKPSSAALADSLAAGARAGGKASVEGEGSNSSPVTSPIDLERERIRQKRLERFTSTSSSDNFVTQDSASSTEKDSTVRTSSSKTPLSEDDTFEVGDCIKISWSDGQPQYGVIKWLGKLELSGSIRHTAGLEMEERVEGGHSGIFNGNEYFSCDSGHGLLLPVDKLQRDDRFNSPPEENSSPQRQGESSLNQLDVGSSPSDGVSSPSFTPNVSMATPGATAEVSPMQKLINVFTELSSNTPPLTRHRNSDSGVSSQGSNQLVFYIPKDRTGLVVGKEGKNVQEVERETNTSINIKSASSGNGKGVIIGSEENCKRALLLILTNLERRISQQLATTETIAIPNREAAGRVIGKKGCNKKAIEALSGAKIKIIEIEGIASLLSDERQCKITGSAKQIEQAKELIEDAMGGVDVAGAAFFAAMFVKLASHFREMGFEFPDDI